MKGFWIAIIVQLLLLLAALLASEPRVPMWLP